MSYSQTISERHKALVIIAIDQSGSMAEPFEAHSLITSKSEIAAIVASAIIDELIIRSQADNYRLDLFDIAILGYHNDIVEPLIYRNINRPIPLYMLDCTSVIKEYISYHYKNNEGHLEIFSETYSQWITPQAKGVSNMGEMFRTVTKLIKQWCANPQHSESFPPIFINISDGVIGAKQLSQLLPLKDILDTTGTSDGKTLTTNVLIVSRRDKFPYLDFPTAEQIEQRHPATPLAMLSSPLPPMLHKRIREGKPQSIYPHLALCYNGAILEFISALNIKKEW